MASPSIFEASTSLIEQLTNPAARALALGCAAGLGLAAFRVKATSARLFTWKAVLYAALAMPILGWILPPLPVPAPAFFQNSGPHRVLHETQVAPRLTSNQVPLAAGEVFVAPSEAGAPSFRSSIRWNTVAAGIYLGIAFLLLARFFVGLAFARRLMRTAHAIEEPRVAARIASRARSSGLSFIPQVGESEFVSVPVTMGAIRSAILLPLGWRGWDDAKLDAVIAHEISHVARRDALTQHLSLLHRAIFWFSPLAWWLDRHLAELAEQASDEAALSCGADRGKYARTLLGFFEALHAAPGRVWWQGVAMAKAGQAEQRVERILAWKGSVVMPFRKSIAVVVVAFAVSAVYLVAAVHPASQTATAPTAPPAVAATPPTPPQAPHYARAPKAPAKAFSYAFGYDDEQRFVIVSGNSGSLAMSGSTEDAEMVQELRKTIPGDFIWFERDGKSYIIRDQATIDRARKFWAPQEELGKKQEVLGKQQEVLGKQQEELGAKMEQIQVNVPDMTAELDKLKAELQQLNSKATVEQVGRIQSEIGELQSKIGELQSQAGEQQSKLGEKMGALGEKQGKLGEQQGELGRQQAELAREATRKMKQLLDEAITKGTATTLKPSPASL
jgi:beta-lactamase regulating signal transducer with metallopeptidase domain